jgi:hypothetical protein
MTHDQMDAIWERLLAAFPAQPVLLPTQKLYRDYLLALPWRGGRTEAEIDALIATHESPFLPAIGQVVAAVGVHDVTHRDGTNAARQLAEAVRTGHELVPDLSTASGWAVGEAIWPVPPLPEAGPVLALPAGGAVPEPRPASEFTEAERQANLRRLGGLFRSLGAGKKAAR